MLSYYLFKKRKNIENQTYLKCVEMGKFSGACLFILKHRKHTHPHRHRPPATTSLLQNFLYLFPSLSLSHSRREGERRERNGFNGDPQNSFLQPHEKQHIFISPHQYLSCLSTPPPPRPIQSNHSPPKGQKVLFLSSFDSRIYFVLG